MARCLPVIMLFTIIQNSCTPKLLDQQESTKSTNEPIIYLSSFPSLEHQEDDRLKYIVFKEDSFEIEEEGADDVREVAVFYANHPEARISILSTGAKSSIQRAETVMTLMPHFGIASESISVIIDQTQPLINDNVIIIKVHDKSIGSRDIALSNY